MYRLIAIIVLIFYVYIVKSNSITPLIIFNDENGINYESLDTNDTIIAENATRAYLTDYRIKGFDIIIKDKYIVWSSTQYPYPMYLAEYRDKVINAKTNRIQVFKLSLLLTKNTHSTRLAVDWVHNLVYFFKKNILTVIHINDPEVNYELTRKEEREYWKYSSGNIVVNPIESFIVWTEYNSIDGTAIMRKCNEDGSEQQIIVYRDLRLPICIAIDYKLKLILWIDNELHSLSSVDYFGNNRQTLIQSKELFKDCSSMDVLEDYVYWASPKDNRIQKIKVFNTTPMNSSVIPVVLSDSDVDFVKILTPLNQQLSKNYCSIANCSHICLPSGHQNYRCLCSDKIILEECDEKSMTFIAPKIPELKANVSAISELMSSKEPLLLFTARKRDIRITKLPESKPIYYMDSEYVVKLDNYVTAIDFNFWGNFLIWLKSDSAIYTFLSKTSLYATPIDETLNNNSLKINSLENLLNISENSLLKSLTIDWIHNLAYFPLCDMSSAKGIYAVNLSSPDLTLFPVITQNLCITKDIRVDPLESLLFWSEYEDFSSYSNPYSRYSSYNSYSSRYNSRISKIKKSSQDGSEAEILVESNYVRKSSLTLDIVEKRLYWIDFRSFSNTLSSIAYNKTDKRVVFSSNSLFEDFSSMDLFDKYIYWFNTEDDTIMKVNKEDSNPNPMVVMHSGVDIDAIKIIHRSRQPKGRNKCLNNNCSHICLPSYGDNNFKCLCPQGMTWNGNTCEHITHPTRKSTTTITPTRMINTNVVVLDNEPKLLFVVYKEGIFLKQNVEELNVNYIETLEMLSNMDWLTEIDFNYRDNYYLWLESSVFDGYTLYASPIVKNKANGLKIINQKMIVSKSYYSKRFALDWIHNLVYLSVPKGIEVISIESKHKYDLITHEEVQGDIALDPIESIIVWSQWSYDTVSNKHYGAIYKSNQDGSGMTVLTHQYTRIPNTVAIDIELKTIYWIDTSLYGLYSMDYLGNNITRILVDRNLFEGSFSMDIFEDYIYWSNYERNAILKTNKYGLNSTTKITVINAYTDIEGLKVIVNSRQPNGTNRCLNANCSQLCLPVGQEYRCVCDPDLTENDCIESKTVKTESITTAIAITNTNLAFVDHNHIIKNISEKLDSLMNRTEEKKSSHHWILIISLVSIAFNLILIIIFIYRKKRNPISKYILAKFRNDREEIFLDERLSDDL